MNVPLPESRETRNGRLLGSSKITASPPDGESTN
jgi:hypothetical protein